MKTELEPTGRVVNLDPVVAEALCPLHDLDAGLGSRPDRRRSFGTRPFHPSRAMLGHPTIRRRAHGRPGSGNRHSGGGVSWGSDRDEESAAKLTIPPLAASDVGLFDRINEFADPALGTEMVARLHDSLAVCGAESNDIPHDLSSGQSDSI